MLQNSLGAKISTLRKVIAVTEINWISVSSLCMATGEKMPWDLGYRLEEQKHCDLLRSKTGKQVT